MKSFLLMVALVTASLAIAAEDKSATSQQATGSITGSVVGTDGKPVAGCIVAAQQAAQKMREPMTATTDDNGEFTIENVPEGQYNLKIGTSDAKGKATKTVNVHEGKTAKAGELKLKYR